MNRDRVKGRGMRILGVLLCLSLLSACVQPVKSWQRKDLAREEMAWDPDPMSAAYRQHVHFSKEASTGGASVGGGGCGCN